VSDFVYRRQFAIEWGQCDPAGIVFNAKFFEFFDRSAWLMFEAALGVPPHRLFETYDLLGIPIVDARATFRMPVKFGDLVDAEARISEFGRASFTVGHRLSVGGVPAVEGHEKRVWAGRHPDDVTRMKAKAIPDGVLAKLRNAR
jgi:4-hydroxybenzoyl-CoA thioesterase